MTDDLGRPYLQVGYFGIWADETGDDYSRRDAVAVIRGAVIDCCDEDMRTKEVAAALAWLVRHGGIKEGMAWAMCARATYDVMCRHLNYPDPALAAAQAPQRVQRSRKRAGSAQGGGVPAGRPVRKRCRLGSEPDSRILLKPARAVR